MKLYIDSIGTLYEIEFKDSIITNIYKIIRLPFFEIRKEKQQENLYIQGIQNGLYQEVKNPPEIGEPVTLIPIKGKHRGPYKATIYICYILELNILVEVISSAIFHVKLPNKFHPNNYYSFYGHMEWVGCGVQPSYQASVCLFNTLPKTKMFKSLIQGEENDTSRTKS